MNIMLDHIIFLVGTVLCLAASQTSINSMPGAAPWPSCDNQKISRSWEESSCLCLRQCRKETLATPVNLLCAFCQINILANSFQKKWLVKNSFQVFCNSICKAWCTYACVLSHVWLFVTPWTVVTCDTSGLLSAWDFSREEYCSGLPFFSSRGYSQPRDRNYILGISCVCRQILYDWANWEAHNAYINITRYKNIVTCFKWP